MAFVQSTDMTEERRRERYRAMIDSGFKNIVEGYKYGREQSRRDEELKLKYQMVLQKKQEVAKREQVAKKNDLILKKYDLEKKYGVEIPFEDIDEAYSGNPSQAQPEQSPIEIPPSGPSLSEKRMNAVGPELVELGGQQVDPKTFEGNPNQGLKVSSGQVEDTSPPEGINQILQPAMAMDDQSQMPSQSAQSNYKYPSRLAENLDKHNYKKFDMSEKDKADLDYKQYRNGEVKRGMDQERLQGLKNRNDLSWRSSLDAMSLEKYGKAQGIRDRYQEGEEFRKVERKEKGTIANLDVNNSRLDDILRTAEEVDGLGFGKGAYEQLKSVARKRSPDYVKFVAKVAEGQVPVIHDLAGANQSPGEVRRINGFLIDPENDTLEEIKIKLDSMRTEIKRQKSKSYGVIRENMPEEKRQSLMKERDALLREKKQIEFSKKKGPPLRLPNKQEARKPQSSGQSGSW